MTTLQLIETEIEQPARELVKRLQEIRKAKKRVLNDSLLRHLDHVEASLRFWVGVDLSQLLNELDPDRKKEMEELSKKVKNDPNIKVLSEKE
jgi:hypothetical protein